MGELFYIAYLHLNVFVWCQYHTYYKNIACVNVKEASVTMWIRQDWKRSARLYKKAVLNPFVLLHNIKHVHSQWHECVLTLIIYLHDLYKFLVQNLLLSGELTKAYFKKTLNFSKIFNLLVCYTLKATWRATFQYNAIKIPS